MDGLEQSRLFAELLEKPLVGAILEQLKDVNQKLDCALYEI
jgi:hypothetical protein